MNLYADIWIADFICAWTATDAAAVLVEATMAATDDIGFESYPYDDRSPGARAVAERIGFSLAENHSVHALAWRAIAFDGEKWGKFGDLVDALSDVVRAATIPGIPRAQTLARLRVWQKLATAEVKIGGGGITLDIFAFVNMNWRAELPHVGADDLRARSAFRPPVSLLAADRWDDAAEEMRQATIAELHPRDMPLIAPEIFSGGGGLAARTRIDALVEVLFAAGTEAAGELALGWMALACSPGNPKRLHAALPQLQILFDSAAISRKQRQNLQARLDVWWQAAAGKFEDSNVSIFRIAAKDTDMFPDENYDEDGNRRAAMKELAADIDPDVETSAVSVAGPFLVVMPKEKSTKLDGKHSVHGAFKMLVGARMPLIVARDVAGIRRQLHSEYPHATVAVDLLLRDLREDRPVTLKPMLLVGGPGAGKSRFVRRLGELLGLYVFRYDGASSLDNMFGGTSKSWSSTQPSAPARAVQQSGHGNPIVMIDEIEKSGTSTRSGNIWHALLPFLDTETSARMRDPSLDAELNLGLVTFIATANDDTPLPAPLKDRFRIIRVPDPTIAHLTQLAANVMRELTAADETRMHDEPLADDELENVGLAWRRAGMSMRKLQKIVGATLDARDQHAMRH